jgi:hypothetical protein
VVIIPLHTATDNVNLTTYEGAPFIHALPFNGSGRIVWLAVGAPAGLTVENMAELTWSAPVVRDTPYIFTVEGENEISSVVIAVSVLVQKAFTVSLVLEKVNNVALPVNATPPSLQPGGSQLLFTG